MRFIGQPTIMNQLSLLLPELFNDPTKSANILIRGPSGWGKTRMAILICNYLVATKFQLAIGDNFIFNESLRVHLIDEAHLIKEPEYLYHYMDSGKYVIVFTTNSVSVLPEALSNRCFDFNFEPYTLEELKTITQTNLWEPLSDELLGIIVDAANRNPRVIVSIASRINLYQRTKKRIYTPEHLLGVLKKYMGIINGLDTAARRYIDVLKELGGTAGLDTLSTLLHINKDSLRYDIEPVLLEKRIIQITSKGRILNDKPPV